MRKYNLDLIENFLKENNLSKKEFAKMCGLSVKTVDRIYAGKNIKMATLIKIAKVLHCKYSEFLGF